MPKGNYWDWVYDEQLANWRLPYPRVYSSPCLQDYWIAEASDGNLYLFPDVHGGWHMRRASTSKVTGLQRVEVEIARAVVHKTRGYFTPLWPESDPYILAD
jgi:hypothetical protein